jgi:hypothetical protein
MYIWDSIIHKFLFLNLRIFLRFEAFKAVVMKSSIFWNISTRSPLIVNRRFGGAELCLLPTSRWFLAWLILRH